MVMIRKALGGRVKKSKWPGSPTLPEKFLELRPKTSASRHSW